MRKNPFPVQWLGRSVMVFAMLLIFGPWTPDAGAGTDPKLGGSGTVATGSAGGASSQGASSQLERCDESLGTIAVVEDQSAAWYHTLSQYKLGSTVPVLRMMIQQSNCFVVVERGAAMRNMMQERNLSESGEMREGSSFQKGQMVAADYTMSPTITFSQKGTSGMGGALGGLFGGAGRLVGAVAGGIKANESSTTLLMIDNRSGVQLAAAEGSAKNYDFNLFGGIFGAGPVALDSRLALLLDRDIDEIAHDGIDVLADIADLGELGCLDLDERRVGQPGQPARDLGLADSGGTDHQDVLGCDLGAQLLVHLLAPPAVAQRDGHRAFGRGLAHDVSIKLGDDLLWRHRHGIRPSIQLNTSIVWFWLV